MNKSTVVSGHNFSKKGKVSVWASQHPYEDVPDEYFEETFSHNKARATNTWSSNFNLALFNHDKIKGVVTIIF